MVYSSMVYITVSGERCRDKGKRQRPVDTSSNSIPWNYELSVWNHKTFQDVSKGLKSNIGVQIWAEKKEFFYENECHPFYS